MFTITHLLVGLSLATSLVGTQTQTLRPRFSESYMATSVNAAYLQGGRNQINGHVMNTAHQPLADIYVELLDEVNSTIDRKRTDGGGAFHFSGMSGGNFQVRVMNDGSNYEGQTQSVSISSFVVNNPDGSRRAAGGESVQVDFTLKPAKNANGNNNNANGAPGLFFAQEVPAEAKKFYTQALTSLDVPKPTDVQTDKGMADLQKAVELFPTYFYALDRLGTLYANKGKFDQAMPLLAKAVEVNPRAQGSWYWLGVSQYSLKQVPTSIESFRKSTALNPNSFNSQLMLGMTLRQQSKLEEAETHLRKAEELGNKKVPDVYWQLALLHNQLKKYKESADELEIYLQLQPDLRDKEKIQALIKQFRAKAS